MSKKTIINLTSVSFPSILVNYMVRTNNNSGRRRSVRNSRSSGAMSRGRFLRTAGLAAAGVGAATFGMSGVARSALPIPNACGTPEVWTLWAGQDINAGTVTVWNDGQNLYVKYDVTGDWCITETHLWAGTQPNYPGYDRRKNNAPIPGHFPYKSSHDPCVKTYTYAIPLSGLITADPCQVEQSLYIIPHAAIERVIKDCKEEAVVYGIERNTGAIYGVDLLSNDPQPYWHVYNTGLTGNSASPNGLAYDTKNGLWYYTDYNFPPYPDNLYATDGTNQYPLGQIVGGKVACGDFDQGAYYYIPTTSANQGTDALFKITFSPDGKTKLTDSLVANIANRQHYWKFNGDIAVKGGVVYGWGLCDVHRKYEFFTYDIATNAFNLNTPAYQASLQLAFGSNGLLYGHRSGGGGEWFVVDETNGNVLQPAVSAPGLLFTDASSGDRCVPEIQDETAFGGDKPGDGRRWWYYLQYIVKCCNNNCQTETAWGGNTPGQGAAWWYYFDTTNGVNSQDIWAGQNMLAGNVTVTPNNDGTATISIMLNDGWQFQNVAEPVKIQGYNDNTLPTVRPAAGLFTTYKGTALIVNVPLFSYYAIHLDVQKCY